MSDYAVYLIELKTIFPESLRELVKILTEIRENYDLEVMQIVKFYEPE